MKKGRRYLFIFVIVQVALLLLINTFSYARYVSNSVFNYYLESKSFYFTSDYLSINTTKNVNNVWDGSSTHFSLKNSINNGAVSEIDINYTVSCSVVNLDTEVDCFINGTHSSTYNGILSTYKSCINNSNDGVDVSSYTETECEVGGYIWKSHAMESDIYFDLVPKNDYQISDAEVLINVSTSPYNKVLKGKYIFHKVEPIVGSINSTYENYIDYDRLNLTNTYSQNRCVSVKWNADNLRIDALSSEFSEVLTDENGYINQFKLHIDSKKSVSYRFYKTNNNIYSVEDFVIEELDGC